MGLVVPIAVAAILLVNVAALWPKPGRVRDEHEAPAPRRRRLPARSSTSPERT